jgi:hypothetical protein
MGKLVAVVREDKNGKKTTRWVKGSSVKSGPNKSIPAPVAPERDSTPRLDEIIAGLSNSSVKIDHRARELLENALKHSEGDEDQHTKLSANIMFMIGNIESHMGRTDLNNLAVFAESMRFRMTAPGDFLKYVRGLAYENEFTGISDFLVGSNQTLTKEAQSWVYAASRLDYPFTESLGGSDGLYRDTDYEYDEDTGDYIEVGEGDYDDDESEPEYVAIAHRELSRIILQFPDKAEQIVHDLNNEGIRDMGLLRQRLTHPQTVLRDGVL